MSGKSRLRCAIHARKSTEEGLDRLILRDDQWERMSQHIIIGDDRTRGSSGRDNRMFVEAVLWIVRTGSPWRDLPKAFGDWNSVFRRFSRWSQKGMLNVSLTCHSPETEKSAGADFLTKSRSRMVVRAVWRELVSIPKFPDKREFIGNFADFGQFLRSCSTNRPVNSVACVVNSEQGIVAGLQGQNGSHNVNIA